MSWSTSTTCLLFVSEPYSEKYLRHVHPVACSLISKAGCIVFGGVREVLVLMWSWVCVLWLQRVKKLETSPPPPLQNAFTTRNIYKMSNGQVSSVKNRSL